MPNPNVTTPVFLRHPVYKTDSRFLTSPVEEDEEEGEVGFRPLKVIGRR